MNVLLLGPGHVRYVSRYGYAATAASTFATSASTPSPRASTSSSGRAPNQWSSGPARSIRIARRAGVHAPADDLVAPVRLGAPGLHHDPRVHGEHTAPAERARRVDLDHRLARRRGIRRLARRATPHLRPLLRGTPTPRGGINDRGAPRERHDQRPRRRPPRGHARPADGRAQRAASAAPSSSSASTP